MTQLLKIGAAIDVARADRGIAEAELKKSENETVLAVHQLYYGLLIAYKERDAAQALLTAAQENLRETEEESGPGICSMSQRTQAGSICSSAGRR